MLGLGWSLWAYEAVFDVAADADPAGLLTMEFTNWREREQAANLSITFHGRPQPWVQSLLASWARPWPPTAAPPDPP